MDQDSLRSLATLFVFLAFIGLSLRVYSKSRKAYYDKAAMLPFDDNDNAIQTTSTSCDITDNGRITDEANTQYAVCNTGDQHV